METRIKSIKVTKTFHGWHTFCSNDKFPDRAAAALANAVLIDVELITESQKTNPIDKSKLRHERQNIVKKFVKIKLYFMSE